MTAGGHLSPHWLERLPQGTTSTEIASLARETALEFINGSSCHWGKRDLAEWLCGPYARATRHAGARIHTPPPPGRESSRGEIDLSAILRDARWHVLAELEAAALPRAELTFTARLVALGYVIPARADDGIAWLPVDADVHADLTTRVLSLFAADALARPLDYEESLYICHHCERVVFDALARRRGNCGEH